ncbi:dienelactone hydrolase family protein [Agromyces seonyuensis]|uniref:Dienelactone hydrolase n=1 Tax=Agromyces seonyuensis TaxID=2662446 RepID=A0A6I4NSN8_9MICO|nr:dienelactone hydrolase family protein [Agromyces seonyuensis]MWB97190.1 dienelactone hydrolase [Agromyces seonyuensis]
MAEIVLFHHALGATAGIRSLAAQFEAAGHRVHVPDLFEGRTFPSIEEGVSYAGEVGFGAILERGRAAVEGLPDELAYVGCSLGVLPAQLLAQTRPGATGAIFLYSCVPPEEFGGEWPADVPVQIHGMANDPYFADEGDLDAARELVSAAPRGELFVYDGDQHYFADPELPSYRPVAAEQVMARMLEMLRSIP